MRPFTWRRAASGILSIGLLAGVGAAAAAAQVAGGGAPEDLYIERNVMVPMRDGVRLATDLYMPARGGARPTGRFPALVQRIAYGKAGYGGREAAELARAGYVVVFQDVRGRFGSEGEFHPYGNEGPDGYDTVAWIRRQPWSDGKVGAFGASYTGGTAHALTVARPPGLGALFASVSASNYWEDAAYLGGAPQLLHNLGWSAGHASDEFAEDHRVTRSLRPVFESWLSWLRAPARAHVRALELMPEFASFYQTWLEHAAYDDYWKQNGYNVEEFYDVFPKLPVFYVGGWYDLFLRGTLRNYTALAGRGSDVRLIVGPWTHSGGTSGPFKDQVDFGPEAGRLNLTSLQVRWFDQWLKGADGGFRNEPPVRIFVMGGGGGRKTADGRIYHGGQWRSESEWPIARMTPVAYYLHAGGRLGAQAPAAAEPSAYTYDPADPVPTLGGNMTHGRDVVPMGAADQRCRRAYPHCKDTLPLSARADVLVFETEPLASPVEVTGTIRVKLFVASSALDTDFTAKLVDVYPPSDDFPQGFALNLADGVIRARYHASRERPALLEPGRVYEVEIDLWGTSNLFDKGHRIRLDISSSNFPRVDANPNTGEPVNFHTRRVIATNRVYHDPAHPSHVLLPVVPAPAKAASR